MLWLHTLCKSASSLALAALAASGGSFARAAIAPGGKFSVTATPGVSHAPKRCEARIGVSWACSSRVLMLGDNVLVKTTASDATATACTTKRVLFNSDEPRG